MITEEYVSFEVAKLLKEKGFNVETGHKIWYVVKPYSTGTPFNSITYGVGETTREYSKEHCIPMPTQQMACRWLREVHDIHIETKAYPHEDNRFYWCYMIKKMQNNGTLFGYYSIKNKAGFDTYEEAVEAALKYCLENILEV